MGGGRVEGGSPQRRFHGGGDQPTRKQWRWTGGEAELLGELVKE
jgi:hypothetical protein